MENKFFVIHWNGEIIQYKIGRYQDQLAIAISAPNFLPSQFLASTVIAEGKGLTMANSVYDIDSEYGFLYEVEAMVFDTMTSNKRV